MNTQAHKKFTLRDPKLYILLFIVLAVILAAGMASSKEEGIWWLLTIKTTPSGELGEIAKALAPLLAIALAIERITETVFDFFEQSLAEVANLGTAGLAGKQWLEKELEQAYKAFGQVSESADDQKKPAKLDQAYYRILKARDRLAGLTNDPQYVSTKRRLSIWLGLVLGLIVAIISDLGVFELLHIGAPRILDMVITGFVIGAGSGPMHSLVGILQGAKDTLDNLQELTALRPIKQQITEIEDQIEQIKSTS
jgi:hypothetical protein